ncbi:type II toxin-antitoxin system RelE/ParE family toxin [Cereibacter sphaeroides]|uniref:type II toxin-antitoxin system RelE family toxin n=1 Tax=Cereibacter sphaeroides TaxID=1063 RepID=UPI000E5A9854|nr:type II toxin-antitoxin system RelE/ParE family toxin [Cereibacter sphaeroides]RIA01535.1 type II toxin-antitoxin system RelE/ParE family toxin [Cereibacter sphaeroides]
MKQISYTKAALRTLRRMPANAAALIRSKIEDYAQDPASQANNVKSLKGREGIRLRVGDWRVIVDDQGNVLAVLEIGPRGGIYAERTCHERYGDDPSRGVRPPAGRGRGPGRSAKL